MCFLGASDCTGKDTGVLRHIIGAVFLPNKFPGFCDGAVSDIGRIGTHVSNQANAFLFTDG